ncbi:hypothetical protein GGX14DRAFT_616595 [Mycena pura]|uniref:Uncharacterized protein n=1 Tax=Mycena pura TaxID=153505 RepID=A0AAD7E553_9AGAR|nr:hypothetical protein GGX14DRAFT_616595 [Mycena pura]
MHSIAATNLLYLPPLGSVLYMSTNVLHSTSHAQAMLLAFTPTTAGRWTLSQMHPLYYVYLCYFRSLRARPNVLLIAERKLLSCQTLLRRSAGSSYNSSVRDSHNAKHTASARQNSLSMFAISFNVFAIEMRPSRKGCNNTPGDLPFIAICVFTIHRRDSNLLRPRPFYHQGSHPPPFPRPRPRSQRHAPCSHSYSASSSFPQAALPLLLLRPRYARHAPWPECVLESP